jgi:hypothetical protein
MRLGQITEGLAAINNPSYLLIEGPLLNNGTTLADTSEASATVSNQTITSSFIIIIIISRQSICNNRKRSRQC